MSTSTFTKTAAGVLLAHTQQLSAIVTVGSAVDVSTKAYGQIFVKVGRTAATALSNNLLFRLEASSKSSGNDEWVPILTFQTVRGTVTATATTVNDAAFNANDTSVTVTTSTGFAAGDLVYFRETVTPANSEWARLIGASGNLLTFEEPITRGHTNGIAVTTLAEVFSFSVNLLGVMRVRLVLDSNTTSTAQTLDVIAWITTFDSIATA